MKTKPSKSIKKPAKKAEVVVIPKQLPQVQADTPDQMLSFAVREGRPLEYIKELMALYDLYKAKIAKSEFVAAHSKFKKEVPRIVKSTNVNYKTKGGDVVDYNHAELGDIDNAIKEPAFQNGLTYDWDFEDDGKKVTVTCIISHVGGHEKRVTMFADYDTSGGKAQIHAKASTITYLQRYTLIGGLGLTTASNDDDGRGNAIKSKSDDVDFQFLPTPNDSDFNKLLRNCANTTVEEIKQHWSLTSQQETALKIAINANNAPL